ncbi:DNA mismatch repair protein MutS [Deltaproteobacteria bacterium TL4]
MSVPQVQTPMMRQFYAIKKDHTDKILFYRMGDFYEMFGEDAVVAAKVLQIALTSRNKNSQDAVPMCGVPYHAYEQYLNKLTAAGYKVAICEQMEDPATAKGLVARDVVRIVTPGTTVSPQLIATDENHYLLALYLQLKHKKIGVAFVDVSTGEFEVAQFGLSELTRLYDFLFQLTPKEILLPQSRSTQESHFLEELCRQLNPLAQKLGRTQLFNFIDPFYFDQEQSERLLTEHFQTLNLVGYGIAHLHLGIAAAGALLSYLKETQKCELTHIVHIKQHSFENHMLLDEATLSNLEIFESTGGERKHTLFHVLNKTHTPMGGRMLRQWLANPLLEHATILQRFDAIDELHTNFILCEELRNLLKEIQDLPRIAGRISLPVVGINDLLALRESLVPLQQFPKFLSHFESPLLKTIQIHFDALTDLLEYLQQQLLEEPSTKLKEGGFIAEGISSELDELRQLSKNSKKILNKLAENEREETGISSLKISYNKVFGYYLNVSNTHKKSVPERYIRKQTLVNCERYITAELKELEEKILSAEERMMELEYSLFQELKKRVVSHITRIQKTALDIATVDVLTSLAYVAEINNYVRPQIHAIDAPQKIQIKGSRHPVIEQIDFGEPFIPNDILLDVNSQQMMLITGPNMAGKSTYMRQIALNVLMAQCGSFIPAKSAELTIVDRIFTRVGASDNLSRGQSTFMVEMNEAASILNNATDRSFIVLDEIGRGTSTFDGISIAWSIVEYLYQRKALTLCATHYHELTALTQELSRVKNFNILVEEDGEHIVFMRKIVPGEADKSYGVHVARMAGLPKTVVDRAMEVMTELEKSSVITHMPRSPETASSQSTRSSETIKESSPSYRSSLGEQLSLFPEESSYLKEIRELNLNNMTPLQALCFLNDLVNRLKK